tara:strand:- start:148 stop:627 length:480 start_codon:yes stop_codon:yes gene_type:complete
MHLTKPQAEEYAKKIGIDYQDWELNLHTIEEHYSYNDIKKVTDKWCEASCSLFRKESTKQSKKELIEMILFLSESLRNKRDYLQTALQESYKMTRRALKNGNYAEALINKVEKKDNHIKVLEDENKTMKKHFKPLKEFLKEYKMWDSYIAETFLTDNNE